MQLTTEILARRSRQPNPKSETRNPKQIRMTKIRKKQTKSFTKNTIFTGSSTENLARRSRQPKFGNKHDRRVPEVRGQKSEISKKNKRLKPIYQHKSFEKNNISTDSSTEAKSLTNQSKVVRIFVKHCSPNDDSYAKHFLQFSL
jgi:hypothetical protein